MAVDDGPDAFAERQQVNAPLRRCRAHDEQTEMSRPFPRHDLVPIDDVHYHPWPVDTDAHFTAAAGVEHRVGDEFMDHGAYRIDAQNAGQAP